ncbi:PGAP1-like protein-domain-containing protein [Umbelopsis sp. AD052]|nr:PGAP1-like protein-domain-containing protein [Umbelopsis sp. AD052]
MPSRTYLAVAGGSFLLLLGMFWSFLFASRDPKLCEMSYSRPIYIEQLSFNTSWSRLAEKYSLYLYREGGIDISDYVYGDSQPVLFIPGHAGSYKQARSIASETTVQFHELLQQRGRQHQQAKLDFFTLNYNEELSAIHGPTLLSQAEFANDAIRYILSLYRPSTSIIIVGHSMGGVIARILPTIPNHNHNKLNTIITLSTPHSVPPAPVDKTIANVYRNINAFWKTELLDGALKDIALISLAGGNLDNIVASDASSLHGLIPPTHGFSVYTTGIPHVWTGADHMAILWCNQLVKRLSTAIIKLVDEKQPSQIKPLRARVNIFRKLLLSRLDNNDETYFMGTTTAKELDALDTAVIDVPRIMITFQEDALAKNQYVFKAQAVPSADFQIVTTAQPNSQLKVNICNKQDTSGSLLCHSVIGNAESLPQPENSNMPTLVALKIPSRHLLSKDLIVVDLPGQLSNGYFKAEFQSQQDQSLILNHTFLSLLFRSATFEFPKLEGGMVHFPNIYNALFRYKLIITTAQSDSSKNMVPIIRMSTSHLYESKFFTSISQDIDIAFHGESSFAVGQHLPHVEGGLKLQIFNQPHRALQATLKVDVVSSLGRILLQHGIALSVLPFAFATMVLCYQLATFNVTRSVPKWTVVAQQLYVRFILIGWSLLTALAVFSHQSAWIAKTLGIDNGLYGLGISGSDAVVPSIVVILASVGLIAFVVLVLDIVVCIIHRTLILMQGQRGVQATTMLHADPLKSSALCIISVLLCSAFIPPPALFSVIFLIQVFACSRALTASTVTQDSNQDRCGFSILVILCCLLPYNGPATLVWVQNLMAGWYEIPGLMGSMEGRLQLTVLVAFLTHLRTDSLLVPKTAFAIGGPLALWSMTYCFTLGIHFAYSLQWVACCLWLLWTIPTKTKQD